MGKRTIAVALTFVVISGCSSSSKGASSKLKNADAIAKSDKASAEQKQRDDAVIGRIGRSVRFGKYNVNLRKFEFLERLTESDGTDSVGMVKLKLRVENSSGEKLDPLSFDIKCADPELDGSWYTSSTFDQNESFPPHSFREGDLVLGYPAKCARPALIVTSGFTVTIGDQMPPALRYEAPKDIQKRLTGSIVATTTTSSTLPARDVILEWPTKWCQATPGMSRDAIIAVMGQPTESFDTELSWGADEFQFNAFLGPDGNVEQLEINLSGLSDAQKASLQCEDTRR